MSETGARFQDKVVIVTGAAEGIGRGCAEVFAREGARLVVNDRPGSLQLKDTVSFLAGLGAEVVGVEADAFSRDGCHEIVRQACTSFGCPDILISNAARSIRSGFLEFPPEDFEAVIRGTLLGGFHISQRFAQELVQRDRPGKIVFISSVQAEMPFALSTAYNAAKAGLNHFARTVSVELSRHRINVNVIEPGWTHTPGEERSFGLDAIEREGRQLPWGRLATIQDIGAAAAFLASEQADYITGTVLPVDGGFRHKDCHLDDTLADRVRESQSKTSSD